MEFEVSFYKLNTEMPKILTMDFFFILTMDFKDILYTKSIHIPILSMHRLLNALLCFPMSLLGLRIYLLLQEKKCLLDLMF